MFFGMNNPKIVASSVALKENEWLKILKILQSLKNIPTEKVERNDSFPSENFIEKSRRERHSMNVIKSNNSIADNGLNFLIYSVLMLLKKGNCDERPFHRGEKGFTSEAQKNLTIRS